MAWMINCTDKKWGQQTWAANIVNLIEDQTDRDGWLLCQCGKYGYIEKSFDLQEPGHKWEPFLKGVVRLGDPGDTYQPFVFLVSHEPDGPATDVWFSYYKDLRSTDGRLKLGYGPGGPPVLAARTVVHLLKRLKAMGCISKRDLRSLLDG